MQGVEIFRQEPDPRPPIRKIGVKFAGDVELIVRGVSYGMRFVDVGPVGWSWAFGKDDAKRLIYALKVLIGEEGGD
jgi:hypothetical protein